MCAKNLGQRTHIMTKDSPIIPINQKITRVLELHVRNQGQKTTKQNKKPKYVFLLMSQILINNFRVEITL